MWWYHLSNKTLQSFLLSSRLNLISLPCPVETLGLLLAEFSFSFIPFLCFQTPIILHWLKFSKTMFLMWFLQLGSSSHILFPTLTQRVCPNSTSFITGSPGMQPIYSSTTLYVCVCMVCACALSEFYMNCNPTFVILQLYDLEQDTSTALCLDFLLWDIRMRLEST